VTRELQVRIIEDQQAAKRREHDRQQRLKNMELLQHVKLLRSDLQQQVPCAAFQQQSFVFLLILFFIEMQWKQKHQMIMLERERSDAAKAADLKAKVENARVEAKEQKQTIKEHYDSAATMMRVVASTFAKLAAVEKAREKSLQQSEMEVRVVFVACCCCRCMADEDAGSGRSAAIKFPSLQEQCIQVMLIMKEVFRY
jgi:hypothetical protein